MLITHNAVIAGMADRVTVIDRDSGAVNSIVTGEGAEGIDVYNTMLTAMGTKKRLGPEKRESTAIDAIRV